MSASAALRRTSVKAVAMARLRTAMSDGDSRSSPGRRIIGRSNGALTNKANRTKAVHISETKDFTCAGTAGFSITVRPYAMHGGRP